MFNRATNLFDDLRPRTRGNYDSDRNPGLRLLAVYSVISLSVGIVAVRMFHVKSVMSDTVGDEFQRTTMTYETIPSRDGRILALDGQVLAEDVRRYDVLAHFRWLESPADPAWAKKRAMSKLTRQQRRDPASVDRAIREVLQQRDAMWQRLATVTDRDPLEISTARQAIQHRVERIVANVQQRRDAVAADEPVPTGAWWQRLFDRMRYTMTHAPQRASRDPLVIREELEYHRVIQDIDFQVATEIEAHPELYPGLRLARSSYRAYPQRDLAAHIIGIRTPLDAEQAAERRQRFPDGDPHEYRIGDHIGRSGVERQYDDRLHGQVGRRRLITDRRGEIIGNDVVVKPVRGQDVYLTLHLGLQATAEGILDAALAASQTAGIAAPGGSVVALDVHTGAVLVAANAPRYDLNIPASGDSAGWQQILNDQRKPLFCRATQMAIPPGSVFKALSAIALLESRTIDPDEPLACQGFLHSPARFRCYIYRHHGVGHGDTRLVDALTRSCNVYFYHAAEQLGPQPFVRWARQFGFGSRTGIDLPGERRGNLPEPAATHARRRLPWYRGDTLGLAIGQARLTATPLQIARMMAAIANGGELVTPHVVTSGGGARITGSDRESIDTQARRQTTGALAQNLARVREGLARVVAHPRGTGYKSVRMSQIAIAGKTGTAEVQGQGDHAWFAGYVPADRPRIAFAVVLQHAGTGGKVAGPVARQFVEELLAEGILKPERRLAAQP